MQIKDVEKLTGLTAKSIRLYEDKGLLEVARSENGYRSYTEENVERLRYIRVLRYLGFSLQEMSEMFADGEDKWKEHLLIKKEELADENDMADMKLKLLSGLLDDDIDGETIEEYSETIDYMESGEFAEFKESVILAACGSLAAVITDTIVLLAPIVWLFIYIASGAAEKLVTSAIVALAAAVAITLIWTNYIINRKRYEKLQKQKDKGNKWQPLLYLAAIVAAIGLTVGLFLCSEKLLAPDGWLFYCMRPWAELVLIIAVVLLVINLVYWVTLKGREAKKETEAPVFYGAFQRHPLVVSLVWVFFIAFALLHVTYVTEDSIVDYSMVHPLGKTYAYSDVDKVYAAFGSRRISLLEYNRRGNFYYTIYLDGHKRVFYSPSPNGEVARYEDSYLELEEFDDKLVKLGVEKESDDKYWKWCDYDKEYVDRFRRIIANK